MEGENNFETDQTVNSASNTDEYSEATRHLTPDSDGLSWPGRGTIQRKDASEKEKSERLAKLSGAVKTILECVGEDPDRESLRETPERYAKAMLFFTKGYEENLNGIMNGAIFKEDQHDMVIVRDIDFFSLCEHHLVPFSGKVHVGYVPNGQIIGLSKIARVVDMFSRRLQVQERLTRQIAIALLQAIGAEGIGIAVEATHFCMAMRGVQKIGAAATTTCMLGSFRSNDKTREEFLRLLG